MQALFIQSLLYTTNANVNAVAKKVVQGNTVPKQMLKSYPKECNQPAAKKTSNKTLILILRKAFKASTYTSNVAELKPTAQ